MLFSAVSLLAGIAVAASIQQEDVDFQKRAPLSAYAPVTALCPSTPLVRKASGIGSQEQTYVNTRKPIATKNFQAFLKKTGAKFPTLSAAQYPTMALTSSGGGLRALLCGAGVHLAFDSRDGGNYSTAGLYQSLTYEAGLSGGAWLLSSIAANNYPTITSLQDNLWSTTFADSTLVPGGAAAAAAYAQIASDVAAKEAAGFNVSIVDPYGREIAYDILYGAAGGVADRFSDIATLSNFTHHNVPFPIITALGVDQQLNQCEPPLNATQYEISPYEFGSWDAGVKAFTLTKYLGSSLNNGKPTVPGVCIEGFDNTAFMFGTSSDIYPDVTCILTDSEADEELAPLESFLPAPLNSTSTNPELPYALYPNPFYGYKSSTLFKDSKQLTLCDGGLADQNNPIWPFLNRPDVSVLFVNDNSADTSANYPNGSEIYTTYIRAQQAGLGYRMPVIPDADTFVAQGLNIRPTFFGCNCTNSQTLAIAFLPNVGYDGYDSGTSTFQVEYTAAQTAAEISNGALVGSYNNTAGFDTCLACLAMKKVVAAAGKKLPSACTTCFSTFCYN